MAVSLLFIGNIYKNPYSLSQIAILSSHLSACTHVVTLKIKSLTSLFSINVGRGRKIRHRLGEERTRGRRKKRENGGERRCEMDSR